MTDATPAAVAKATEQTLGIRLTLEQAALAIRECGASFDSFSRTAAEVIAEWTKTPKGRAILKRTRGEARYAKRVARKGMGAKPAPLPAVRKTPPPSDRFLTHALLTRMKQLPKPKGTRVTVANTAPSASYDAGTGEAPAERLTSLPLPVPEPPPIVVVKQEEFDRHVDRLILGVEEPRRVVDLDGQKVRVAETPEQVATDEVLYGVVAVEVKK